MWPFDEIGGALGDQLGGMLASAFEAAMMAIWKASLLILHGSFHIADQFSVFTVDTRTGPISVLWPMMLWISGILALGLFFWQLTVTSLRGGRGFVRLVGGPVQYGIALAVTVGFVAAFLAAVDGITSGILSYGLQAENFTDALDATGFGDAAGDGVNAIVLGLCAFFGVIPAAIGYSLEMLFREAAVYVLLAAIPLSAAGLLAGVTAPWYWRSCRWLAAAICMKSVLALALVLGVAISGGAQGLSGLLAGVGVLLVSLLCPFVLFRLFAFVDPNTDAGAGFRDALSGLGVDSYGANNPAVMAAGAVGGSGGGGAIEDANSSRLADEVAAFWNDAADDSEVGQSSGTQSSGDQSGGGWGNSGDGSGDYDYGDYDHGGTGQGGDEHSRGGGDNGADAGQDGPYEGYCGSYDPGGNEDDGDDPPPAEPPGPGGGSPPDDGGGGGPKSGGPKSGGSGGAEAAAGAEEAAVIV